MDLKETADQFICLRIQISGGLLWTQSNETSGSIRGVVLQIFHFINRTGQLSMAFLLNKSSYNLTLYICTFFQPSATPLLRGIQKGQCIISFILQKEHTNK